MSGLMLADGVEFEIGMTLHFASNLGPKEQKTSHKTHYIKDGELFRRRCLEDDLLMPSGWLATRAFSTRNAALDDVIAGNDRQIERLKEQRDRLEAMKQ